MSSCGSRSYAKARSFSVILEPRRRIDQALYAVVMEAYVNGVSTRSVEDLVVALGIDSGVSKSEVSRICAGLDEIVTAFRGRPLHHAAFPYVFLDATYLHVRRTGAAGQVTSMAVVVATGVTASGGREVLGVDVGHFHQRGRCHQARRRHLGRHARRVAGSDRRYLSEGSMAQLKPSSDNETVAALPAGD